MENWNTIPGLFAIRILLLREPFSTLSYHVNFLRLFYHNLKSRTFMFTAIEWYYIVGPVSAVAVTAFIALYLCRRRTRGKGTSLHKYIFILNSYSAFQKTFDRRFAKFVVNFICSLRTWKF